MEKRNGDVGAVVVLRHSRTEEGPPLISTASCFLASRRRGACRREAPLPLPRREPPNSRRCYARRNQEVKPTSSYLQPYGHHRHLLGSKLTTKEETASLGLPSPREEQGEELAGKQRRPRRKAGDLPGRCLTLLLPSEGIEKGEVGSRRLRRDLSLSPFCCQPPTPTPTAVKPQPEGVSSSTDLARKRDSGTEKKGFSLAAKRITFPIVPAVEAQRVNFEISSTETRTHDLPSEGGHYMPIEHEVLG
nr:hypothetical protein Iba_chr06bCG12330 [Ipomoea batatas]